MNEQIQNPKRIRFTPEITLGNILQLLSIAAAVVGLWVNMDKRISAMEVRENYAIEEAARFEGEHRDHDGKSGGDGADGGSHQYFVGPTHER